jgi:hypothetical protein
VRTSGRRALCARATAPRYRPQTSARNAEPVAALESSIENTVRFWASEEVTLAPLYGAAAIDPAARDLVDRQRADRRSEFALMLRRPATPAGCAPG